MKANLLINKLLEFANSSWFLHLLLQCWDLFDVAKLPQQPRGCRHSTKGRKQLPPLSKTLKSKPQSHPDL